VDNEGCTALFVQPKAAVHSSSLQGQTVMVVVQQYTSQTCIHGYF
jgi:hypothetical protein